jgi:hypothetical protein
MDTTDEETFPCIPIRYMRGRSDQNESRRKSEVSHSSSQSYQNGANPRQSRKKGSAEDLL